MKQIIFFKKTWALILVLCICKIDVTAQTPAYGASLVSPGYNSCSAGRTWGLFYFPIPSGLTLSQLTRLETDFETNDGGFFTVQIQSSSGPLTIGFLLDP